MFCRWMRTVPSDTATRRAIWALVCPAATRRSSSHCRRVSSGVRDCPGRAFLRWLAALVRRVTSLLPPAAGPASPPDRPCGPALAVPDLVAAGTGPNPAAIPANPQAPLWRPAGQDSPPPHRNAAGRAAAFSYTAQQRAGTAERQQATAVPFREVTVNREMSSVPQDWADSGGCPAGGFGRRSVLPGRSIGHPQAPGPPREAATQNPSNPPVIRETTTRLGERT